MRRYWGRILIVGGVVLCLMLASAAEAGIIEVFFQGQNVRHTLFSLSQQEVEYVQLNKVAEMFQLTLDIDPIDGRVVLRYGQHSLSFFPGQNTVIANRRTYFLDIPPRHIEGVIMVPLQFLTAIVPLIYDQEIVWDPANSRLVVGIQDLEIFDLYPIPYGEYTRIVVEMNRVVSYKIREKLPSLLIFEFPQSTFQLPENPLQIHSPAVQHVKVIDSFGSTQIILRLGDEFLRYTHQLLEDPVRLVIDVYNARETLVEAQTPDDIVEETLPTDTEPMTPTLPKRSPLLRTV
ncbi:hypothetical protein GF339_13815, partial [candidate division KSB3 bacterium]|nr:hypothetical protein [candidate division KSB3 bacterium]MBD3325657.1 hypothetical protein [candidate division KSB3 bacterium]